jgi:predicted negative regulator of RcsB-dependent stress response
MTPQQTIETEGWSFTDWIQANTRAVGVGLAIVALGGAGYWFYVRSAEIKRLNAERSLNQAKQAMSAGNQALAKTDLQRVASRYKGTPAGSQAAMIMAQMNFGENKIPDGIKILEPYQTSSAAGANLAAIWALTGDGHLAAGRANEAANTYMKAADATKLSGERGIYMAKAARAYMAAGKNPEARAIWEKLASDPESVALKNEANMRLGELTARAAGTS